MELYLRQKRLRLQLIRIARLAQGRRNDRVNLSEGPWRYWSAGAYHGEPGPRHADQGMSSTALDGMPGPASETLTKAAVRRPIGFMPGDLTSESGKADPAEASNHRVLAARPLEGQECGFPNEAEARPREGSATERCHAGLP